MANIFGVRRQSEAATALWIVSLLPAIVIANLALEALIGGFIQSAVAASLCRRTPETQYKLKLYSNCMYIDTGWPLRIAGKKRI